jgi:agmatinase
MTHIGIRDARSREGDDADAVAAGARVFTRRDVRNQGVAAIVEQLPSMSNLYVTIDIDSLDPSIAPGTGSPAVDGLLYHELREILEGVATKGRVVGFDLTEVNPYLDLHGMTCQVAVTVILEFLGAIFERPR